ncbi:MAG: DUF302 domain-containing protein [Paludibacter sp.]|nr:DUF302 domain-containing protein [Paludibacter sp.]
MTEELKKEGFGILSEINIHEKLKEKLDVDFRKYKILGACNPAKAYEALQAENKIGIMLPCNVIVQELGNGKTEVAAVDPVASMMAVESPELESIAKEIRSKLQKVIDTL